MLSSPWKLPRLLCGEGEHNVELSHGPLGGSPPRPICAVQQLSMRRVAVG